MAELIFAEQTQAFEYFEDMGVYAWESLGDGIVFALVEGQTYTAVWDGNLYSATAKEMTLDGVTGIGLGNEGIVGLGEDNGQPFLFAYVSDYSVNACYSNVEGDTHTVAIYMTTGANIVTYDRNGQPVIHTGIETVSFNTDVEGEVATYYLDGGNTAEGVSKEVELNLADGDQTVEADPETLMSEVVIKKPVTLLPENIANGVNIAGVVGTLESGGGGSGGGGGVSVPSSDINFYDYDGTRVAAWTLDELAAATALPDNPSHDGLVAQGWNWSLADLKATNRIMDVGQCYITDDGKTRLYIEIMARLGAVVPLSFTQTVENGVTIDWGDGSALETLAGTGDISTSHTYPSSGDYVITLDVAEGCKMGIGSSSSAVISGNYFERTLLRKVEIGENVESLTTKGFTMNVNLESITIPKSITEFGVNTFSYCEPLGFLIFPEGTTSFPKPSIFAVTTVCIPNSVKSLPSSAFASCSKLKRISIPNGVTSLGTTSTFEGCYRLSEVSLPDTLTEFSERNFFNCYSLDNITIPSSVKSLGIQTLANLQNLKEIHFKGTTPPTASYSLFDTLPTTCKIYVPAGSLSAYTSAANYPSASTYTYIEE